MRSADDIFADLEADRLQREAELRLMDNLLSAVSVPAEQDMLRRSIVVLTYSHFEGFCKFALLTYAGTVNAKGLPCKDAAIPLVALTLTRVFSALREGNSKHPYFSRKLPDDNDLHRSARERIFIEDFLAISAQPVDIPDTAIDTKSNLSAIILKRNLYQLGLDYPPIEKYASTINRMLGVRNAISHGDRLKVPKPEDLEEYVQSAFDVMRFVQSEIYSALKLQKYHRISA